MTIPRELSFLRNHASLSNGQRAKRKNLDGTSQETRDREVRNDWQTTQKVKTALQETGKGDGLTAEMPNSGSSPDPNSAESVNLREAEGEDSHSLAQKSSPSSFSSLEERERVHSRSLFGYEIQGKDRSIQKLKDPVENTSGSHIDLER